MSARQPSVVEVAQLGVIGVHAVLSFTFGSVLLRDHPVRGVTLLLLGAVWAYLTYVAWERGPRWEQAALAGVILAATGVFPIVLGQPVTWLLGLTWLVLAMSVVKKVRPGY